MRRAWFLIVPLALFMLVLVTFDLQQALHVGLLSFVSATLAYLLMNRLAWRGANIAAIILALAGPMLFALAENEVGGMVGQSSASPEERCPAEGCVMISFPAEPGPMQ